MQKHYFFKVHSHYIISLVIFHMQRAGAYWHKIHDIHMHMKIRVHSLYKQNSALSRLDFFFGGSCEDIVRLSI